MTQYRTDIRHLLINATAWTIDGDVVHVIDADGTDVNRVKLVSYEALLDYEARLPAALRVLHDLEKSLGNTEIPGYLVRQTVTFWQNPCYLDDIQGKRHAVAAVLGLPLPTDASDHTAITLVCWTLHLVQHPPQDERRIDAGITEPITVCVGNGTSWIEAPVAWMDNMYPDWRNRMTVAVELGLTKEALVRYVLDAPVSSTVVTLPEVPLT